MQGGSRSLSATDADTLWHGTSRHHQVFHGRAAAVDIDIARFSLDPDVLSSPVVTHQSAPEQFARIGLTDAWS